LTYFIDEAGINTTDPVAVVAGIVVDVDHRLGIITEYMRSG